MLSCLPLLLPCFWNFCVGVFPNFFKPIPQSCSHDLMHIYFLLGLQGLCRYLKQHLPGPYSVPECCIEACCGCNLVHGGFRFARFAKTSSWCTSLLAGLCCATSTSAVWLDDVAALAGAIAFTSTSESRSIPKGASNKTHNKRFANSRTCCVALQGGCVVSVRHLRQRRPDRFQHWYHSTLWVIHAPELHFHSYNLSREVYHVHVFVVMFSG